MQTDHALQALWDWVLGLVGVTGVASPALLLTAVVSVLVWQFYINGEKPTRLAGSQNEKIVVKFPNNRAGS